MRTLFSETKKERWRCCTTTRCCRTCWAAASTNRVAPRASRTLERPDSSSTPSTSRQRGSRRLKALGAGTLEAAPVDWHAPMFRMAGLVSERGACRSCGDALFASTLPPPPPEAGREDAWAATVGLRLRREAANALDHLTRCGANACASCGAIDYKLLRALCLQAVSAEQRAALLLPKHNLFGDYRVDLRGLGRPSVDVFRTLDRGSDTQCSACCCGSAASSGSDGTRVHRRTGTAVRETRTPRAVTVSIAPHGESSCRTCGRRGTVAAPLKYCARCRDVLYCSRDCQVADWPTHRGSCNQG